jgi:hypothetical protein
VGGHGWDAALAQARGETRWGGCGKHGWDAATGRGEFGRGRGGSTGAKRGSGAQLGPRASARGNPLGRVRETRLGCSRRARGIRKGARGEHWGEAWVRCTVGPSREREGKPAGEGTGNTVGMQPPPKGGGKPERKREGKPAGEGTGNTVGMQPPPKGGGKPERKREGKSAGGRRESGEAAEDEPGEQRRHGRGPGGRGHAVRFLGPVSGRRA